MSASDVPRRYLSASGSELEWLHFDEREQSATCRVRHPGVPPESLPDWDSNGFNSYAETVTYVEIAAVMMRGWPRLSPDTWNVSPAANGRVTVTLRGPGCLVTFEASRESQRVVTGLRSGPM